LGLSGAQVTPLQQSLNPNMQRGNGARSSSFLDLGNASVNPRAFISRHLSACSEKEEPFGHNLGHGLAESLLNTRGFTGLGPGISELLKHQQQHKMSIDFTNLGRPDQK
jgi:hypothetical protein